MSGDVGHEVGLYLVISERHEPKEAGAKIINVEHRILASSCVEAYWIVQHSNAGTDEIIREVRYASHITQMSTNCYKIVPISPAPIEQSTTQIETSPKSEAP